ncbi:XPA protein C-terminus-domain-containing protein [Phyllosticta citribraziliensis]|uniref:XPA protein C-terminus-domain-containing protein n=1 Tax=Phyllosticta citribraziliensis TaxID=989973 RepID=A0ABR1LGA3_9PEZI
MSDRPSTPPRQTNQGNAAPLTPEQVRQLEINRLKAKALRDQTATSSRSQTPQIAGQKRSFSSTSQPNATRNHLDARTPGAQPGAMSQPSDDAHIRPAAKYRKSAYIEYDLSAMTDTKGGFLSATDDPHNRALHGSNRGKDDAEEKPAHMTLEEWQRHRLLQKLRATKSGPFEPGISVLDKDTDGAGKSKQLVCRECGTPELDWTFQTTFNLLVCNRCKEEHADKYSLLTKTEAREDYLLTEPELRDEELLPRMERPNPHKASFHSMQLFVRCQVEEYAFSARKWGSAEALDDEFERREIQKKDRKEKKWKNKLEELKKRTRVDAYRRQKAAGIAPTGGDGREAQFGDKVKGRFDKHEHEWGRSVEDPETGAVKKRCIDCGMEVEELEF